MVRSDGGSLAPMAERLVVIGGDAAGMSAASQARRRRDDLEIVALERGDWTSYSACGIPYLVAGEVDDIDSLISRSPETFRSEFRIDVRLRHEVTGIDTDAGEVEVHDIEHGRNFRLGYDQLMIGTGGRAIRPEIEGIDLDFVHGVQTLGDAQRLLDYAEGTQCGHVVVVGAGYIGLELAEAFTMWGADVTIVEQQSDVMPSLDPDLGALISAAMVRREIDVICDTTVTGCEPGRVHLGERIVEADMVVLGTGVRPNSELAAEAGIETGVKGAIRVDRRQRASAAGVWSAGDCAESTHFVSGAPTYVALGTTANRQGRVAGINIGGEYATFPGVLATAASRFCALEVARTGLSADEARAAGFEPVEALIESSTKAGYYPGSEMITVKLVAERGSGRLLGGQIVGGEGSAKRIDVLATALMNRMSVDEIVDLDLSYAPPFGGVWDPVLVAARRATRAVSAAH